MSVNPIIANRSNSSTKFADPNFDAVPFVPSLYEDSLNSSSYYTLLLENLQPGVKAILVDEMFKYWKADGKLVGKTVQSFLTPQNGIKTIKKLRDSIYNLIYINLDARKYNKYNIMVGNPANFRQVLVRPRPVPVQITDSESIDENGSAAVRLTWRPVNREGRYQIEYKKSSEESYSIFSYLKDKNERSIIITPLDYGTIYNFRILTKDLSNSFIGYSQEITLTTISNTEGIIYPNLIVNSSFEEVLT